MGVGRECCSSSGEREAGQSKDLVRKQSSPCHVTGDAKDGLVVLVHEIPEAEFLPPSIMRHTTGD